MSFIPPMKWKPGQTISAASTNAKNILASPGFLGYLSAGNVSASPRFAKVYDTAGTPVVGTDTPVATFILPGNTSGAGNNVMPNGPIEFVNGIAVAITGGMAPTDATAIGANEVCLSYGYNNLAGSL